MFMYECLGRRLVASDVGSASPSNATDTNTHNPHTHNTPTDSVDQEEAAFEDYFKQMPWLALPFDGDEREHLMSTYQVLCGWVGGDRQNTRPGWM